MRAVSTANDVVLIVAIYKDGTFPLAFHIFSLHLLKSFVSTRPTYRIMLSHSFFALLLSATTALAATNDIALYWGQNVAGGQGRLRDYCQSSDAQIVIVSSITDFKTGFGEFDYNCYKNKTTDIMTCPDFADDIKECQNKGKKVLLSIGAPGSNSEFANTQEAEALADTLWNKFGTGQSDEKPFGDAVVDGFDFHVASGGSTGYAELAKALKSKFDSDRKSVV